MALMLMACLLAGCASEFQIERATPRTEPLVLKDTESVYVTTPPDASFGDEPYPNSGKETAGAVVAMFSRHSSRVESFPASASEADAIGAARTAGFSRVAVPTILRWENRATEWTGQRDALTLRLAVYDAKSGTQLDSATINAKGTWWTFGGLHPEDLLSRMMKAYEKSTLTVEPPKRSPAP